MTTATRTQKWYGDFGILSKNYCTARRGFPDESVAYIFEILEKKSSYILDMGCGTGIATRQLCEKGARIVGTDIDNQMVRQAEMESAREIEYRVAPAERQPFADQTFDAVTAFSAFHWFANKEALNEIKRVLKPDGVFFVVNKNETGDFKRRNKEILQRFISRTIPDIKKEYNPRMVLEANGFRNVIERHFHTAEYFSPEEALAYIQTMSVWNLISVEQKGAALNALRKHFSEISITDRIIERKLDVVVISGRIV